MATINDSGIAFDADPTGAFSVEPKKHQKVAESLSQLGRLQPEAEQYS